VRIIGAIMLTLICSKICPAASSAARLKSMTAAMWSRQSSSLGRSGAEQCHFKRGWVCEVGDQDLGLREPLP
jgi:hypothetical protein